MSDCCNEARRELLREVCYLVGKLSEKRVPEGSMNPTGDMSRVVDMGKLLEAIDELEVLAPLADFMPLRRSDA